MPKIARSSVKAQNKKKVKTVREMTEDSNKIQKLQNHAGCKLTEWPGKHSKRIQCTKR